MMNWEIVISAKGLVAKDEIDSSLAYKGQAPRNDKKRSFHVIEGLAPKEPIGRIAWQSQPSLLDFFNMSESGNPETKSIDSASKPAPFDKLRADSERSRMGAE